MTFLPWQEVDQRDCNGITWHQRIPEFFFCKSTAQNTWLPWLQKHCKLHIHDCLQCGGFPEGERLDGVDVVPVVAGNSGQARLSQLTKLRLREWLRVCIWVVVESEKKNCKGRLLECTGKFVLPVAMLKSLELVPDNTLEDVCGNHYKSMAAQILRIAEITWKVGPTILPGAGVSLIPPMNKSTSSTDS